MTPISLTNSNQLLAHWKSLESVHVWDLIECLLQFASHDPGLFRDAFESHRFDAEMQASAKVWEAWYPENVGHGSFYDLDDAEAWLRTDVFNFQNAAELEAWCVSAAYELADQLATMFGNQIFARDEILQRFSGSDAPLPPGRLIPITRDSRVAENYSGYLPSRGQSVDRKPDRLWNCRLLPDTKDVKVSIHTKYFAQLDDLLNRNNATVFATGVLNWNDEWTMDKIVDKGVNYIVKVRPAADDQWSRIEKLVKCAEAQKVDVLILPELCVCPDLQGRLIEHFRSRKSEHLIRLLVAGSVHVFNGHPGPAEQQNEARVVLRNERNYGWSHRKFQAFRDERKQEFELLRPPPPVQIHLYLGRNLSIAILCCKDFLSDAVVGLLHELQPTHVFVPAHSVKTDLFSTHAGRLAVCAQSRVVIANGWLPWKADRTLAHGLAEGRHSEARCAYFAMPHAVWAESGKLPIVQPLKLADIEQLPALCVFNEPSETPECKWIYC